MSLIQDWDAVGLPPAALEVSPWLEVVGGPPPADVMLRDVMMGLLLPLTMLVLSWWAQGSLSLALVAVALLLSGVLSVLTRRRWRRRQRLRVVGNVLEHQDGEQLVRLALARAVISAAASPPEMLVMVMDDGVHHLAVGRRADEQELSGLPLRLGPYLELRPEDFDLVRVAAHRPFATA